LCQILLFLHSIFAKKNTRPGGYWLVEPNQWNLNKQHNGVTRTGHGNTNHDGDLSTQNE
jgi:hypothetical protein